MEFHEKLQELRKQKKLTQEQLAEKLYVSRAAVSKWESGRGYPNIDSLKAIANFYGVTIDEMLSGDALLTIAQEDQKQRDSHFRDLVFGSLDLSAVMFFFLPLFGQRVNGSILSVSLPGLTGTAPYLKAAYITAVLFMVLWGLLTLLLQNCGHRLWVRCKTRLSLLGHILGTLLFIVSSQPYCGALLFLFLGIKVFLLTKKQ